MSNSLHKKNSRIDKVRDTVIPANWQRVLFIIFIVSLVPVYWVAICAPGVGIYHDDGIYLVTAKALAEGVGYRIISLPGEIVQTKYPILFPTLLAIVWKISPNFPENVILLKMVPLLGTFFWVLLLHLFLKRKTKDPHISIVIILITLALPCVVFFSATILSETVFAFFCMGALIFINQLEISQNEKEIRALFLSSIFTAAAFLTRTAGVPIIFAGTISLFLRRRYMIGLKFFLLCAIFISPWFLWQMVHNSSLSTTNEYYSSHAYNNWNIILNYNLSQKAHVFALNILYFMFAPIRLLSLKHINVYFDYILVILVNGFFFIGFLEDFRKGVKSIHLFIIMYCGMLLVWVWPPSRFIVPIFPIWLLYAYEGFIFVFKRLSFNSRQLARANVCLILILSLLLWNRLYYLSANTRSTKQVAIAFNNDPIIDNWVELSSFFDWIRENTPGDSVLIGNLDPTYYLYTGRKAVRGYVLNPYLLYYSNDSEESVGNIKDLLQIIIENKVNYIIVTPSDLFKECAIFKRLLNKFSVKYKGVIYLEKDGSVPGYQIYRVDQERLQHIVRDSFT